MIFIRLARDGTMQCHAVSRKKEVSTATVQTSTITLIDVIICSVAFKAKESKIGGGWGTKEEGKEN